MTRNKVGIIMVCVCACVRACVSACVHACMVYLNFIMNASCDVGVSCSASVHHTAAPSVDCPTYSNSSCRRNSSMTRNMVGITM